MAREWRQDAEGKQWLDRWVRQLKKASLVLPGMLALSILPVQAQQTIFNVPSGDVTPKGQLYEEHESQFRPWGPGRFWGLTHYNALGIGHNTELDVTLYNVSAPASDNISLVVGFKSNIPLLQETAPQRELKITVGGQLPISLQGHGVGSWGYAHLNGRLPKLNTRLTAGISGGTEPLFGQDVISFIGGYEQPVTKRFSLIGDYYSGTHNLGFFIPGFSYTFAKDTTGFFGFQIPNSSRCGKSGLVVEFSKIFF